MQPYVSNNVYYYYYYYAVIGRFIGGWMLGVYED